jgi:hypothetical protein
VIPQTVNPGRVIFSTLLRYNSLNTNRCAKVKNCLHSRLLRRSARSRHCQLLSSLSYSCILLSIFIITVILLHISLVDVSPLRVETLYFKYVHNLVVKYLECADCECTFIVLKQTDMKKTTTQIQPAFTNGVTTLNARERELIEFCISSSKYTGKHVTKSFSNEILALQTKIENARSIVLTSK